MWLVFRHGHYRHCRGLLQVSMTSCYGKILVLLVIYRYLVKALLGKYQEALGSRTVIWNTLVLRAVLVAV